LLWHKDEPIGICVFCTPAKSLKLRTQFFQMSGRWNSTSMKVLNQKLVVLSRIVLHPSYRGAGIAADFIRRSCELAPWPWIELLTQMGVMSPVFEKAGFHKIGQVQRRPHTQNLHRQYSALYQKVKRHGQSHLVSRESYEKSRYSQPCYYIFDNRSPPREKFDTTEKAT
jgi:ABC-type ATPase with predicted acetyltransferase domain